MLTFGRNDGEWIDIGDERTVIVQLSDEDVCLLKTCVGDLRPLADRLLAARGKGVGVQLVRRDSGRPARIGIEAVREIPVDRREVAQSKAADRAAMSLAN